MFSQDDLIYAYTRKQALEDGFLVDVSEVAKEANFTIPVALTHTLWEVCVVPDASALRAGESIEGRLWDLLWMLYLSIKTSKQKNSGNGLMDIVIFSALFSIGGRRKRIKMKAIIGPGDDGEPVLTIMFPSED